MAEENLQIVPTYSILSCRWVRGGVEVSAVPVLRLGGEGGSVSRGDQGTYTCTAQNTHGDISTQVSVNMGSIVRCEYDYKIIFFGHTTQHFSEGLLT